MAEYIKPELKVVVFESEDILDTSGTETGYDYDVAQYNLGKNETGMFLE